jgi:hypothetical protein
LQIAFVFFPYFFGAVVAFLDAQAPNFIVSRHSAVLPRTWANFDIKQA